jgi:Flp pilus assembly pilin Flp
VKLPSTGPRLAGDDRGQDLIEYAVIATFISLLAVIAASALSAAVGRLYNSASGQVTHGANFGVNGSASTTPGTCPKDQPQNPPSCK